MNYNLQFITQNKEVCFDIEYTEEPINNSIINEFINDVRITTYGTKKVEYEGFIVRLDEVAKDRYKDLFAKYTKYNRFKKLLQLKNLIDKSSSEIIEMMGGDFECKLDDDSVGFVYSGFGSSGVCAYDRGQTRRYYFCSGVIG